MLETFTYGDSNERFISDAGGYRTYFDSEGGATIAEYYESNGSTTPAWSKSYVYLGARLLSTLVPNRGGGEAIQFHAYFINDPVTNRRAKGCESLRWLIRFVADTAR